MLGTKGNHDALAIGAAVQSELDNASIRSDILINQSGKAIFLGEHAIKERSKNDYMLYEPSPKMWLKTPDNLAEPISTSTELTREMLLILIIGHALAACMNAGKLSLAVFNKVDIRVSHPIWPAPIAKTINEHFVSIVARAIQLAPLIKSGVVVTQTLIVKLRSPSPSLPKPVLSYDDVQEPIAAALTLIPDVDNTPRICAVIDIGAGTTDIGIFQTIYPDASSDKFRSLIPIGDAVSLFTAGNAIDQALLHLISSKGKINKPSDIEEIKNRIRQLKESIFADGVIRELGVNVHLKELMKTPDIIAISVSIRNALQELLSKPNNYNTLSKFHQNRHIDYLDIVMGGGGSSLQFVVDALTAKPFKFGDTKISIKIIRPQTSVTTSTFGASIERLAVALGGSNFEYERLKTKYSEPVYYMRSKM